MKIKFSHLFTTATMVTGLFAAGALLFSSCSKNSSTAGTGTVLPAEAIRGTTLSGGNVKGVMLT
ncbi:MAG TPA: hypothetical protein VG052_08680, partial [Puia sp.]|nr:hypothetical protein [Puia sp.]